jgi:hypothetical protein
MKRNFLQGLVTSAAVLMVTQAVASEKPNVIVILADDMGKDSI